MKSYQERQEWVREAYRDLVRVARGAELGGVLAYCSAYRN